MNGVAFLLVVLGGINGVNAQRRSHDGAVSFTSEGPGRELVDRGPPGRLRAPRETARRLKDTVPQFAARINGTKLAVLRIDANFYDSYQDALYYLYPLVPVGGWVIFDDIMSHPPVARCWQDFQRDQGFSETIIQIDHHSAYFVKTTDVTVDMGKMHAPQDANL